VIAAGEKRKGKNVWVEVDRIKKEGVWWRWDEEKEALVSIGKRGEMGKEAGEGPGGEGGKYG